MHFQGKTVYNRSKGIEIILAKSGEKHFLSNYKLEINDFIASKYLDKIIESSVFISQGKHKETDISRNVIGYYNFENQFIINGKSAFIKMTVRVVKLKTSKIQRYYYDHYIIKHPKTNSATV